MVELEQQRIPSEHPADDVWRAINTPLTGELGRLVNPYVLIEYEDLSDEGAIQSGTLITYKPIIAKLPPMMTMFEALLPKDVALRVAEHDPSNMVRVETLESDKHAGTIRHKVEGVSNDTSLLVIEGEISIGGSRKVYEDRIASFAMDGMRRHNQLLLSHVTD